MLGGALRSTIRTRVLKYSLVLRQHCRSSAVGTAPARGIGEPWMLAWTKRRGPVAGGWSWVMCVCVCVWVVVCVRAYSVLRMFLVKLLHRRQKGQRKVRPASAASTVIRSWEMPLDAEGGVV
jgi:hypothetical protein